MSMSNLTNLGQFCVQLSSGQGKVYRPTDRPTFAKQYAPTSLKGGRIIKTKCVCETLMTAIFSKTVTLIDDLDHGIKEKVLTQGIHI